MLEVIFKISTASLGQEQDSQHCCSYPVHDY